jgi:ribonucleotide reductase alpha subunit
MSDQTPQYDYLQHFKSAYNYLIYLRTYSRWIPELGRREIWPETVARYINFMRGKMGDKFTTQEYEEIHDAMLKMDVLGSQRLLQFAGPAVEKNNACVYNCSFISLEKFKDFADLMFILLNGVGVGFSCESKFVSKLPFVKQQTGEVLKFTVQDDREGWADSILFGMESWYEGKDVVFDYSLLRPKGARLRTMGGRSSGPQPLIELHDFTRKIILSKQGQKLSTIDVHDIVCKIGNVVVVGGTRRSSLISLSDLNDEEMRNAKTGAFWETEPQRCMANNSAVYTEKPCFDVFNKEWQSLVNSGSGERGIFNKSNLHEQLPERRVKLIQDQLGEIGTNPCVVGDSWIHTTLGPKKVIDLLEPFDVPYQKSKYHSKGFYSTGIKEVYRLTTYNGYWMELTKNHPVVCLRYNSRLKIELSNLQVNDVICLSNHRDQRWKSSGDQTFEDGYTHGNAVHFQAITDLLDSNFDELLKQSELMSYNMYLGFIKAMLELSGNTSGKSIVMDLYSFKLASVVHRMLYRIGVISVLINDSIYIYDDNIDRIYDLVYSENRTPSDMYFKIKALYNGFSFNQEQFTDRVKSIELIGFKEVYDTTVEGIHEFCCNGICSSNCGEIYLVSKQFCNLSTVICRPEDDEESLKKKIRIAAMLGTYQSTLTDFKYISPEFKENVERERLLGVSMTGQHDCLFLQQNTNIFSELKQIAIDTNKEYAERFGINESTAITCVKPEGTTSEMVGSSSGIHARYAPYYVRRVRISATDPLAKMLLDQKVDCSPEVGETWENVRTYVFSFPQKSPDGSKCIDDMSVTDQLEYWKIVKTQFTEHNPSTTVKVRPEEWDIARNWILDNWHCIGGLAFLPTDSVYKLAPFEKISEEEYREMMKGRNKIDFSLLSSYEKEDETDVKQEYACVGDNCTL